MIEILTLIWAVSAAVSLEAHVEAFGRDNERLPVILIGSLMPVFNTIIAWNFLRDALRKD